MRKNNFLGLMATAVIFCFLTVLSCSKDDGCETKTYYLDKDGDNYGAGAPTTACKTPTSTKGKYVTQSGDPDDTNADIFPGCVTTNYYADNDGDGFGAGNPIASCVEPVGKFSTLNGDPNDNDDNIGPQCTLVFYLDEDNDGFGVGEPLLFCANPDENMYTDFADAFDCDDTDPNINPDTQITYFPDVDGDGFGDAESKDVFSLSSCEEAPEGFVTNDEDCDDNDPSKNPDAADITYYPDVDGDGFGNDALPDTRSACANAPAYNYVLQGGDCDDNNAGINPAADDLPNDGIDSNCDGVAEAIIWNGPLVPFSKAANANWVDNPANHDQLTEKVSFTRTTEGYITNIVWWTNEIGVIPTEGEDLPWEYKGRKTNPPMANVGNAEPFGGPYGVRWAILEQGSDTPAWDNFNMYGTLGEETNFYSLNNIATMCYLLDINVEIVDVVDEFGVNGNNQEAIDYSTSSLQYLVGKTLGVWLVEENIYFTLTFDDLSTIGFGGGVMSYSRSSNPFSNN